MPLSAKQRRFVEEYLVDLNATKAAERAGYSARTAGSIGFENLKKPEVAAAIEAAQKARSERTGITADRVVEELARIGFADIREVVGWQSNVLAAVEDPDNPGQVKLVHSNDVALVDSGTLSEATAAAIAEISQTKTGALKVKLHPKIPALVKLGEHLGLFRQLPVPKKPEKPAAPKAAQPVTDDWADELGQHSVKQ